MRKALSVSLVILVLFQLTGYLLIFETQRYQIRKEIKHRIKLGILDKELVLFKIPISSQKGNKQVFQWIDSREFRYCEEMYDVVRKVQHHDTTWIYCISDEKETQLFAHLDEQINRDMKQNTEQKQQRDQVLLLATSLYLNQFNDIFFIYPEGTYDYINYHFNVKTWIKSPVLPPPKI